MGTPVVLLEVAWRESVRPVSEAWQETSEGFVLPISTSDSLVLLATSEGIFVAQAAQVTSRAQRSLTTVMRGNAGQSSLPHQTQIVVVEKRALSASFVPMPDCGWEVVSEGVALKLGQTGWELLINKHNPQVLSMRQSPPRVDPFLFQPKPPAAVTQTHKVCPNCGSQVRIDATFCGKCGTKVA